MDLASASGYAFNALRRRRLRSWLTISGVIVGIAAIVLLVGLVEGLRADILQELESFGPNTIIIIPVSVEEQPAVAAATPGFMPTSGKLYLSDYDRVRRVSGIDEITPVIMGRTYVEYRDKTVSISIFGVEPGSYVKTAGSIEIEKGRFLTDTDRKVAVVGSDIAADTFEREVELGSNIYIGGERYKVVGIRKKTGESFSNVDSAIFIPFEESEHMFEDILAENEINAIRVIVREGENVSEVADEITSIMLSSHRVSEDDKDFGVITPEFINQQVEDIASTLSLFLGAVAGISLIVGGVGITNTMFMSVLERRKEIGVLKSVGSKNEDILLLFLIESSFIGISGGLLGMAISYFLVFILRSFGVSAIISPTLMAIAIIFSATVGIVSGIAPAYKAARLDPVEALRAR